MINRNNKYFILILFLININCIHSEYNPNNNKIQDAELEVGKVQIKYLNYSKKNQLFFKEINYANDLFVNFHSIDCDIKISRDKIKLKK